MFPTLLMNVTFLTWLFSWLLRQLESMKHSSQCLHRNGSTSVWIPSSFWHYGYILKTVSLGLSPVWFLSWGWPKGRLLQALWFWHGFSIGEVSSTWNDSKWLKPFQSFWCISLCHSSYIFRLFPPSLSLRYTCKDEWTMIFLTCSQLSYTII